MTRGVMTSSVKETVLEGDGSGGEGLVILGSGLARDETPEATMVFLHGMGDSAQGWAPVFAGNVNFKMVIPDKAKVILPSAQERPISMLYGDSVRGWFDIDSVDYFRHNEDVEGIAESSGRIEALLAAEAAETTLFVGGFAHGASMAYDVGLRSPLANLAGVFGFSGFLTRAQSYPMEMHKAALLRRFVQMQGPSSHCCFDPAASGTDDRVTLDVMARGSFEILNGLNLNVTYHSYPDLQHSVCQSEMELVSEFFTANARSIMEDPFSAAPPSSEDARVTGRNDPASQNDPTKPDKIWW